MRVGVRSGLKAQTHELVGKILRGDAGSTHPKKLHLPDLEQPSQDLLQRSRIDELYGVLERSFGVVAEVLKRLRGGFGLLGGGQTQRADRQLEGQRELEILKPGKAQVAAKANHTGLGRARTLGQLGNGLNHHLLGVDEGVIGNFTQGRGQVRPRTSQGGQRASPHDFLPVARRKGFCQHLRAPAHNGRSGARAG